MIGWSRERWLDGLPDVGVKLPLCQAYDMTEAISRNVEFKNKRTALSSISVSWDYAKQDGPSQAKQG